MSWSIVKDADGWRAYRKDTAEKLRVREAQVAWGNGPLTYPALVTTYMPPVMPGKDPQLVSAYVYPADAEELLKVAGVKFRDPDEPVPPTQKQFNRWKAAEGMAVAYFLVETGICTAEQFEDKLLEMIEKVDMYQSDKKEELKAQLRKYEATVLDTLNPPG